MKLTTYHKIESKDKRLSNQILDFENLLGELSERDLNPTCLNTINQQIDALNGFNGGEKKYARLLRTVRMRIFKSLEKEHKIVPKNYYTTTWLVLGMTIFGLPFGLIFSVALDNFAFIGIGLPIGMPIGMALGASKDAQAAKKGLQLKTRYA